MIGKLFGKKKKDIGNPDKGLQTLQALNTQIDTLEKKLDFLDKQGGDLTNQAKAKPKEKNSTMNFTIVGFHYDKSVNNVEVSTVLQIVDATGANCVRRNNILNRNATHIVISACRMKDNYYCFYLVFGNKK